MKAAGRHETGTRGGEWGKLKNSHAEGDRVGWDEDKRREILAAMGRPIYALDERWGGHRMIGSFGNGTNTSIGFRHRRGDQWIEITTKIGEAGEERRDWMAMQRWFLLRVTGPGELEFPIHIRADRTNCAIPVDGVEHPFTVIGDDMNAVAHAFVGDRWIEIDGRGVDLTDIALVTTEVQEADWPPGHDV
jgi:hypothetical protein